MEEGYRKTCVPSKRIFSKFAREADRSLKLQIKVVA
jgi:hypothetical protein